MRWKKWFSRYQLINNTSQGPHVNRMVILDTQDNLWSTIVPTLNIEKASGAILATCTEIYQFYVLIGFIFENYVFGFHVAMDYFLVF